MKGKLYVSCTTVTGLAGRRYMAVTGLAGRRYMAVTGLAERRYMAVTGLAGRRCTTTTGLAENCYIVVTGLAGRRYMTVTGLAGRCYMAVTVDKYYLEMKKVQTFCMHTYAMCRLVSGSLLRYGHCVLVLHASQFSYQSWQYFVSS